MIAAIEARGLRREYGSIVALADLTLAVEPGEILPRNATRFGLLAIASRVRRRRA